MLYYMDNITSLLKKLSLIKDPDWYLYNQDTPFKIYSNLFFLFVAIYFYNKNIHLFIGFLLLFVFSSLFHIYTNKTTLFLDRFAMIFVFSAFYVLFYNNINFSTYLFLGTISLLIWYFTDILTFYFLFQLFGLLLLLQSKIKLIHKIIFIVLYVLITYSQLYEKGKLHGYKHILLPILGIYIYKKL
jgi:hypothetical protein